VGANIVKTIYCRAACPKRYTDPNSVVSGTRRRTTTASWARGPHGQLGRRVQRINYTYRVGAPPITGLVRPRDAQPLPRDY
jgi:hypothetical protein